ncbi:MAG: uracil phosphoribosyltransferase [Elusimicrobia bacterium]|nr:uracil phosphoribosyltransferase [Elusimicrobiota bacterium]
MTAKSAIHIISHPLLQEHLMRLRDKNTEPPKFRWHLKEAAKILFWEVLSRVPAKKIAVQTPLGKAEGIGVGVDIILVNILRASLGMTEGMIEIYPKATMGHIGLYRDETTLKPVQYYVKVPRMRKDTLVVLVDPMLATGGSAVHAVKLLKKQGAKTIAMISLIAANKGVKVLTRAHPDVDIYLAAVDEGLNDQGFIVPGLGDCGDRQFGTL